MAEPRATPPAPLPGARGAAGRQGEGIRSDLWVALELRDRGAIEIELTSRVDTYYGESIREQVRSILGALGVRDARVEVQDKGALPFVIAARVEAAALRAGVPARAAVKPEVLAPAYPPSPRDRLRRSRLYVPGNEPKYFVTAALYDPDGVILDLEDSVHPEHKDATRVLVRNALRAVDFRGAERMVRINPPPLGQEDLEAIVPECPDVILVPKVETADQVVEVDRAIGRILGGLAVDRPVWLMPILESALGIEHAFEIARASPRVAALTIGLEDYASDLGVPRSEGGVESLYARTRLVNAARAAGVQPIDSVYGQVEDLNGLRRWAEASRQLGFVGMGCLHPRQIPVVHDAFRPPREQIERALAIVAAYEQARARGLGVVSLGSKMIDPPVVQQALRIVEQARRSGAVPEGPAGERGTAG
jgi:citrate lyase subunit beta/citryl-CoA lyase